MLTNLMQFVKQNQSDIILIVGVVLIALFSFGAGRMTAPESAQEPIIFNYPSTSSGFSAPASISDIVTEEQGTADTIYQGQFVGSAKSDKYHWPTCQWATRIAEQNQVWFASEEEAQQAGYIRCGSFEKNAP